MYNRYVSRRHLPRIRDPYIFSISSELFVNIWSCAVDTHTIVAYRNSHTSVFQDKFDGVIDRQVTDDPAPTANNNTTTIQEQSHRYPIFAIHTYLLEANDYLFMKAGPRQNRRLYLHSLLQFPT